MASLPSTCALVWFKRDLRVQDHAALCAAAACDHALGLVVVEPEWMDSPECDPQHLAWLGASVQALRAALQPWGLPLRVAVGAMPEVLARLHADWGITHLFSHEETGPFWSWTRDRRVAAWCRAQGVVWQEWPQTGVVRRLRQRNGWAARWQARMDAPAWPLPQGLRGLPGAAGGEVPTPAHCGWPPARPLPPAGPAAGQAVLQDFLTRRGGHYRHDLSSPLSAAHGCSRLSAHLAFGSLSMRQVHQATEARLQQLRTQAEDASGLLAEADGSGLDVQDAAAAHRRWAYHLQGFASRLRWHCHFMQKLEDQPDLELRNLARSLDGLRDERLDARGRPADPQAAERFAAWCAGRTGFPMVDACMRQLRATGWLNFRMRALLVSFAAYHLGLHWRAPGLFLARQFLDFEPGIHWSQMQMQSGTTGINTLRLYSPAKQAQDHDPQGVYRRRWLPDWGTPDYPPPVVDEARALADIKARLWQARRQPEAQAEADALQDRHGSRKSGLPPSGRAARGARRRAAPAPEPAQQLTLFDPLS
ncbi:cryptochrome/deoxyribodipyrimidine photo-lyase family protein [Ideonella livida]|uniref:Deoxyribodipyrimidine photo-lyase/cryptochrome family protein n=1 Tax=Ideonella livida TaxID=2707176 RepID=A0A7C9PIB2_9BURK|nr:cryptochrome/deoxyribodipyrimidine photo-lyase family protein [Ideonella livida]NDY92697.1 deoxyribodipyrimidine photo-lyase/cryptochrome family protein [Ideonella livida]